MQTITSALAAVALAAAGAVGFVSTPIAVADEDEAAPVNTQNLGGQAQLVDGSNVQGWTVSELKQSSDAIPYQPRGTLWEATATDEAVQGGATPIVSNFNAVSPSGQTYRVLYEVPTAQGVNPASLAPGQQTTGKLYVDVTGDNPNSVVYELADGQAVGWWVQATPTSGGAGGGRTSGGRATTTPAGNPASSGGNPAAPAPGGSQGTPIAEGAPANQAATAPPGTSETPGQASTPAAPGQVGSPAAPAAGGSAGTPATGGSPETPATGGSTEAPAPAASPGAPAAGPANPAPAGGEPAPIGSQGASQGAPAS
ncbi:DUF1942 domain-containing protein [Mycobacterium sp.]|uniref:MPT63 family protein n=1 Tax=Mycobacterium sp. TaxID=1785 RepID=UPI0031D2113B